MAEYKCLGNYFKSNKAAFLSAIEETGSSVEWKDEPDKRMDGYEYRDRYGSLWSCCGDLSEFWSACTRKMARGAR